MNTVPRILLTSLLLLVAACATKPSQPELPTIESTWNWNNAAASEVAFRKLLAQANAEGKRGFAVEVQTQLARSLGLQRKFGEANQVLAEALIQLNDTMPIAAIRWQLEQGRVINSAGHPADAVAYFERAFKLARQAGSEYFAIDAAHMLGIASPGRQAIAWNERAIKMVETTHDPRARGWLGPLYNNLAWTYVDGHQYKKALNLFTKDVGLRTSTNHPFEASIARWSRAKTLRLMGRVQEALDIQMQLLENPLRKGKPAEGYTQEEIGECLLTLGKRDAAKPHFAEAYRILAKDPWLQANESARLARLKKLSM